MITKSLQLTSMEMTVISRETIKPSSPTPHHLKRWKLSLMDQCKSPTVYGRMLFFYSADGDAHRFEKTNTSDCLKRALSVVLTDFYPLAGKFNNNNRWIDCNDDGLEYIEARVKAPLTLDQLLACPKAEELDRYLPHEAYTYGTGFKGLSAVQVTVFDACGSMAIGVSISHMVADGSSAALFINSWAAIARGGDKTTHPNNAAGLFNFASLFPPRDLPLQIFDHGSLGAKKLVSKRFVFPQLKIDTLKGSFEYKRPTRVEVVTAVIFKCLVNVTKSRSSKVVVPGTAVDLRSRMSPPVHTRYLGNMVLQLTMKQIGPETSLSEFGMQLGKLTREIDSDYMKKLEAKNGSLLLEKVMQHRKITANENVRAFRLNSWCRFPFHKADVGWGAPIWAAPGILNRQDVIVLLDAKNGDGIEAWVTLEENEMAQFQAELIDFNHSNAIICKL